MVNRIHRVIDRRLHNGEIARLWADRQLVGLNGGDDGLVPLDDHVGRQQAAPA